MPHHLRDKTSRTAALSRVTQLVEHGHADRLWLKSLKRRRISDTDGSADMMATSASWRCSCATVWLNAHTTDDTRHAASLSSSLERSQSMVPGHAKPLAGESMSATRSHTQTQSTARQDAVAPVGTTLGAVGTTLGTRCCPRGGSPDAKRQDWSTSRHGGGSQRCLLH